MNLYTVMSSALVTAYAAVVLSAPVPTHCTVVGTAGPDESFPIAHCADGSYLYQDLDGSDGSRGTVGDGRWLDASGYMMRGR